MGILDHRRGWQYEVKAPPAACIRAFEAAFTGKGGLIAKARWTLKTSSNSATATYQGRKGLGSIGGILSQTGAQEADTAIGSEVSFNIDSTDGQTTRCSMWLKSSGRSGVAGLLGVTSDARFIRPYMQAVGEKLSELDPNTRIQSS